MTLHMSGQRFRKGDRVRVIADGSTGIVDDPCYVYGGVLIMPDVPSRAYAPLTPCLPFELELIQQCRIHGDVDDSHFPCRHPGESAGQFTARMLGETRDV